MFLAKEIALLSEPYFKTIRQAEDYMEVKSINTGHCWAVKKRGGGLVVLYHKHGQEKPYYHVQSRYVCVSYAIAAIKEHDTYVLEKAAG